MCSNAPYLKILILSVLLVNLSCQPGIRDEAEEGAVELPQPDDDNGGLSLQEGFSALVVAEKVGRARHMVVRDNGDIYIALREKIRGGGIAALRDTDGDGRADQVEYFGDEYGTGIDIYDNHLYFSSNTTIYRYPFREDHLLPELTPEVIVSGFPQQDDHDPIPFTIDKENGLLYVNIGAPSNNCMEERRTKGSPGKDPCDEREIHAAIWRFNAVEPEQTLREHGYRFAIGIRNSVALDWNHQTQNLYVVQHGRDHLHEFFSEIYGERASAELPPEEFLLVKEGMDNGWPYCYYDHFKGQRVLAPEYGGDGIKVGRCGEYEPPMMAFPASWAPNDLMFYTGELFGESYKGGAFIAFHGSWDRAPLPQQGYFVAFVPFEGERPAGEGWERFADGFAGKETIDSPDEAEFRPMGLAQGPDGSVYVADSNTGKIWRIYFTGDIAF